MTKAKSTDRSKAEAKRIRRKAVAALGPAEMLFGLQMCRLREKRGLTLTEAARRFGIPISSLSNLEKGMYYPRTEVVLNLAEFYRGDAKRLLALLLRGIVARMAREQKEALAEWKRRQGAFAFSET